VLMAHGGLTNNPPAITGGEELSIIIEPSPIEVGGLLAFSLPLWRCGWTSICLFGGGSRLRHPCTS